MTRRTSTEEREFRDPALAALLQETFQDDPALAPAPGRTERIMRAVLASEKRKPAAPFWASLIWGFGATAAAALIIALMLGLGGMWKPSGNPDQYANGKGAVKQVQPKQDTPDFKIPKPDEIANLAGIGNTPKQPTATMPDPDLKVPERPHHDPTPPLPKAPVTPKSIVPPAPSKDEVVVAAALYQAGTTAYHTGDYETAYQAFQDSYDTVPTPEAALSSGKVLMDMAREELAPDNTGDV